MFKVIFSCLMLVGSGVLASELLVSKIVTPLPKLMKYSEAVGACEAKGMQLARFESSEGIDYTLNLLVEKNLDKVWIGAMESDERTQLALEVFEGMPVIFKIEQVLDSDKMLAVLCEPKLVKISSESKEAVDIEDEVVDTKGAAEIEAVVDSKESVESNEVTESKAAVADLDALLQGLSVAIDYGENNDEADDAIVDEADESNDEEADDLIDQVDLIKSKGGYRRHYNRKKKFCSSSSSSSCPSSSSTCSSSFSCDPFDPTGSSSSSKNSNCGRRKSRRNHKKRSSRINRRIGRNCHNRKLNCSSSTSTSSSSSEEDCGAGRCGVVLGGSSKFFREIRLSQRIR